MLKKLTSFLFLSFFLFGIINTSKAQTPQHFIQSLSGGNSFPLGSTSSNKSQFLILASELSGVLQQGAISKIYITPSISVATTTFTNFTVKIGTTTSTDLGTGTQSYITGLTTALSAPSLTINGAVADQWLAIPLDNPVLYDGTSNLIIEISQTAYTSGISLRVNTGIAGRRIYGDVTATTGSANSGRLDFGMDLNPVGPNNAGLSMLTSPVNFCAGTYPIKVKVKNSGINIIDSVKVAWSLDGVAQPTYSLTDPLDTLLGTGLNEREITLGTHTFTTAPIAFKAWTFLPNNVPDTFNLNDTITQTLQAALNGTYTINAALPTAGTNYADFTSFATALNSFGVCGPVIANVVTGSGPYTERIELGNIAGASAVNTIRINGNGNTVQFNNTTTGNERIMLTLNGSKYVTIDNLNFVSLSASVGWGALITNGAIKDSVTNCVFDLSANTTIGSATNVGIAFSASNTAATTAGSNGKFCYIANNLVKGASGTGGMYYGISIAGGSNDSNIVSNNTIENHYYYAIYISGGISNVIEKNKMHKTNKTASFTSGYFLYTTGTINGTKITGNQVYNTSGPSGNTGALYGYYLLGDGTATNPVLFSNNIIYNINNSGILYPIYLSTALQNKVYHNTVVIDQVLTGTSVNYGIYSTGTNTGTVLKNNNVSITAGSGGIKYGFYYSTSASIVDAQKNNYYVNSTQSGVQNYGYYASAYLTQAAFQTANPTLEIGSPSVNPQFMAATTGDLLPTNPAVLAAGENLLADVPTDINNIPRSGSPTLGAFESLPTTVNDAATQALLSPESNVCAALVPFKAVVRNAGTNNLTSMQINWMLNGVLQVPFSYAGTLTPSTASTGQNSDTVILGSALLTNGLNNIKIWTSVPNNLTDPNHSNDTLTTTFTTSNFQIGSNVDTMCVSGTALLTLTPSSGYGAGIIEWQSSTNGTNWTPLANSNATTYLVSGISTATQYRAQVTNYGATCLSNKDTIHVINPLVLTTTPAQRCGPGTLTLGATSPTGTILNWYANLTGGAPITTGSSFATPSLISTTTYYVAAANGASSADSVAVPLTLGSTTGVYHHMFLVNTTTGMNLNEISLKVSASIGTSTSWDVYYRPDNYQLVAGANISSTGWILLSSNTSALSLGVSDYTTIASNLNLAIPAGSTYSLYIAPNDAVSTHQYASSTIGTVTGSNSTSTIMAGNRGSSLFSCTTNGGQAVVKLKSSTGCESTRIPVVATVSAPPSVNLGNDTAICAGSSLTLNAGASNSAFTKLWSNAATTQSINVTTAGTYSVTVTNSGCSISDTIVVIVNPIPVVNLGNDTTICSGQTLTLNAGVANTSSAKLWSTGATTQTINVTTAGTYYVTVSNGACSKKDTIIISTAPTPAVNLGNDTSICGGSTLVLNAGTANSSYTKLWNTTATTQTISVTTAGTYWVKVTNGLCSKSDSIVVGILPIPTVNLGNDTAICSGSSKILNAGAANSSLAKLWSTGQTTQTITVTAAGTYSVTVGTGSCSKSDTIVITVAPTPSVNLGNDTAICSGTALTLNAGTANTTFSKLWSTGATTQSITVTTAGSYKVTVTNGLCSKKDTINVSVTQTPIVNLGPDTAFCAGSSIILNAGNPNYARIWNTGAATQTISVNTTGTYSVLVNNGLCYKSDTIVITENPLPANVDLGPDTNFCQGNSVILDAGNPGMNYIWNTGATTQTIVASTSGTYIVNVINGFNCSKADTVIVDVDPIASITGIYVTGSSPSYNFSTINPINVSAFNWNFGDGNTGTGATILHTYASTNVDQTYTVTLVIDNFCGSDTFKTTVLVLKGTGVNNLQLNAKELKLYPNPAQQLITVENDSKLTMQQIKISNILGQEVARIAVTNQAKQTINVANLAAGLYNVTIEFEEGSVNRKLEIVK